MEAPCRAPNGAGHRLRVTAGFPEAIVIEELRRAEELMARFAERTGLEPEGPNRRYLWTDAFAVCTYLALAELGAGEIHLERARRLIEQVHGTLGRHREDDPRRGWISGLDEVQGREHPTAGGLRIGKPLPERGPDEPFDERLEWDRDGQYFHYLTKWMHALDRFARSTGDESAERWARELAVAAHRAFVIGGSRRPAAGPLRMVWKMSVDLSFPLVTSMGHHDPLDGLLTCAELRATKERFPSAASEPSLDPASKDFAKMVEGRDWTTPDPLGIGGLLMDACRCHQLLQEGAEEIEPTLLTTLLRSALLGLVRFLQSGELDAPASRRLAFRELGLSIGLAGVGIIAEDWEGEHHDRQARSLLDDLARLLPIRDAIQSFWLDPGSQAATTFTEHRDINEVMLASSLVPHGCLLLEPMIEEV